MEMSAGVIRGINLSKFVKQDKEEYEDVRYDSKTGEKKVTIRKRTVFIFEGKKHTEEEIYELIDDAGLSMAPHWYDVMDVYETVIGKFLGSSEGGVEELTLNDAIDKKILQMFSEFTKVKVEAEDLGLFVVLMGD